MKDKKYKKKLIDLTKLDELTPPQWRDRINLLFNKDIPKQPNTADELIIWNLAKKSESELQQHFHKQFNALSSEIKFMNRDAELEFVQNDNGDSAGGNLLQYQRINLYKRKKAEGSKAGFPDLTLISSNLTNCEPKTIFCEVKKISAPSEIHLTEEQFDWFIKLNKMGFKSYITNNPVFFNKVILGEVRKIL
jgi:hypothetical protein